MRICGSGLGRRHPGPAAVELGTDQFLFEKRKEEEEVEKEGARGDGSQRPRILDVDDREIDRHSRPLLPAGSARPLVAAPSLKVALLAWNAHKIPFCRRQARPEILVASLEVPSNRHLSNIRNVRRC